VKDLKWLHDVRDSEIKQVELGGGETHVVVEEGEVELNNGVRLGKVLFVPTLGVNLCSGIVVTDKGTRIVMVKSVLSVFSDEDQVMSGQKKGPGRMF
jgi:hypothetical protein